MIAPPRTNDQCREDSAWLDFCQQYLNKPRTMPLISDFQLANEVFMADRFGLDLIKWQTAAKERIRWLSIHLAQASQPLDLINELRQDEGSSVNILCENPDPLDPSQSQAVEVNGWWTNWVDQRHTGATLTEALVEAVLVYRAACAVETDIANRLQSPTGRNPSGIVSGRMSFKSSGVQLPKKDIPSADLSELEVRAMAYVTEEGLTLEEGKFYIMRNGQTVGPMIKDGSGFRAHNGNCMFTWHPDGVAARGTINPGDLVKEAPIKPYTVGEGPSND